MIYRGYMITVEPNDPGVLIREMPEPHLTMGKVIGSAASYFEGQQAVDDLILNAPPDEQKKK